MGRSGLAPLLIALLWSSLALTSWNIHAAPDGLYNDFSAFHLVGRLARYGQAATAYDPVRFAKVQAGLWDVPGKFLWGYPPPFTLLTVPLSMLPQWLAFMLVLGGSLTAYLLVLKALAPNDFPVVLGVLFPTLIHVIEVGQNGLLMGAVAGWVALSVSRGRRNATGVALGLMSLKPHLAMGLVALTIMTGRWRALAMAALVALLLAALATWTFGWDIWAAFRNGLAASGEALHGAGLKLSWMTSPYGSLLSLGVPFPVALAAQGVVGLMALGAVGMARGLDWENRRQLGLAALASGLTSPYFYNYDLPVCGLAVALLRQDVARHASRAETILLLCLSWAPCTLALLQKHVAPGYSPPAVGGYALTLALPVIFRIVWRAERETASAQACFTGTRLSASTLWK
ncbi:glycosyltransferase family 87 protein [Rubellimicrobium arenae]|uniref:glycosyltransferase family 87 protein n=1 Tax=Rubellimicrobium arenae TaxID=2817372 RepID=UPI001B31409F|nr:glycosyltransferase family 87 protein [Rubellimicrobium arenae]